MPRKPRNGDALIAKNHSRATTDRKLRILIVPDKFKGTLTAREAAEAIARGWHKIRPADELALLPMSDGGDGFGEVLASLLGARPVPVRTVDAAHRPLNTTWWWASRERTAIIESARVIGLAMLPRGKFHPFELDTFGLGAVLQAAAKKGARRTLIGIGGSATNDGGFGMARALGWKFLDCDGNEITTWTELQALKTVLRPSQHKEARSDTGFRIPKLIVAVDVQNRLLGARGCSRVYGPQKGLRPEEFAAAEAALQPLAKAVHRLFQRDLASIPGAGAAGGLGFGLMAFAEATAESGFELIAKHAQLRQQICRADVVVTGEGSLDRSTLMGKGVGEIATLCSTLGKPCLGLGGKVENRSALHRRFARVLALTDFATAEQAMREAADWLETAASSAARKEKLPASRPARRRARRSAVVPARDAGLRRRRVR